MQLSLVVAFIPIVNILWCGVSADNCILADLFLQFGYSRECVVSSLASIVLRNKVPTTNESSLTEDLVLKVKNSTNTLTVVQTLLQENVTSVLTEVKALLQEVKSELIIVSNFQSEIKALLTEDLVLEVKNNTNALTVVQTLLQEIKSERENSVTEIKALRQEIKSEGENSSSVVKALLQEMKSERENSVSEIKAIRQEIKSEGEDTSSVVKTLLQEIKSERENSVTEIKALRQEIKSEGENSSSVVKALLQEMKSERENSVSEIKTLLQEVKTEQQNEKKKSDKFEALVNYQLKIKNCADLRALGDELSGGVQTVYPYIPNLKPVVVFCDQVTDGGGWTVIQSRSPLPIRENFQRNWNEYVKGFGDPKGEFWLGLDNIHALTNSTQMELRFDLENWEGKKGWALYSTFHVGDAASKYVLSIEGYSGDAGDGMADPSDNDFNLNGMKFSTQDNDNDLWTSGNCAEFYLGAWWFNDCSNVRLNALLIAGDGPNENGIYSYPFRGWSYFLKKATMRIRPVSLGF